MLEESIKERITAPWKDALVVKLLGKDVGFLTMRDHLKALSHPSAGFDLLDLGYGFFLLKFDAEEDRARVMDEGPWMIFYHYLSIRTCSRNFVASQAKADKTLV